MPRRTPTALLASLVALAAAPAGATDEEASGPEHGKIATADATPPGRGAMELDLSYSGSFALKVAL